MTPEMSVLETYLPMFQTAALFGGWVAAMITGLMFAKVLD